MWLEQRADAASRAGAYLAGAFVIAVAVYGAALGGHLAQWQAETVARAQTALIAGGFGINEVIVKGRTNLSRGQVDAALDISRARTIFGFDTRAAKARLEQIGWVRNARVMRLWPSTLLVELEERTPFARWDIRGHTVLIDKDGELLGPVTSEFADLPRVAGEGAHLAAAALFDTLDANAPMARRVSFAERIEDRRWDLVLENGLRVQLPAHGAKQALKTAERLLTGRLPDGVAIIDMRVDGRIALRRDMHHSGTPGPTAQLSGQMRDAPARPL